MAVVHQAGDLVLCHSKGIIGKAIRFAEKHDRDGKYSKWNHVAILDYQAGSDWYIIQAEAKGVTNHRFLTGVAPGGEYEIIPLPSSVNREALLYFARTQVGKKYGYTSILSCALNMVLPDFLCLRQANTWICSGLAAGALWFAGFDGATLWPDLYSVTPADIAQSVANTK